MKDHFARKAFRTYAPDFQVSRHADTAVDWEVMYPAKSCMASAGVKHYISPKAKRQIVAAHGYAQRRVVPQDKTMFNEERAYFIMDLCFPKKVRASELQADLELAQSLAEDWPEWGDVARAWTHHFGKERIDDSVACAIRMEESAFQGKHIDELDVEQFEPRGTIEAFVVTQGVAFTWHAIACMDHEYLGRAVKTMEICERCSPSSVDICWCARQWLTLPIEDSLPRALDAMNHAEALYFADLVAPAETDARAERWRWDRLKESHEWICKEWLRSFGTGLGGRRLRHFQKRAGPGSDTSALRN